MLPPTERGIDKPNISGEVSNRQNVSDQNPYGAIDLGEVKVDLNQTPSHGGMDYGNTPAYDMGGAYAYGNYGAYQTPQYEFNNTNNSDGNNYYDNNNNNNNNINNINNNNGPNNNNNNSGENEAKETVFNMNN